MNIYDFDDFASTSAGRRAATLLRDHKVNPEQMFAMVLAEVTQRLPYLEDGGKYTTKALCDADDWAKWFTAERRVAGMCVAYFAKEHGGVVQAPHSVRQRFSEISHHAVTCSSGPSHQDRAFAPFSLCS